MKINEWVQQSVSKLTTSSSRLDVELLVSYVLKHDRSWVAAHDSAELTTSQLELLNRLLERRQENEPLAYILGTKEFYGRDFEVNKDVLVPRPETESFIELLRPLTTVKPPKGILNVLDMGTGSGCLAITAKCEFPYLNVFATDSSKSALLVAIKNAQKHESPVNFKVQSLLHDDKEGYDVILANLPYVPTDMTDESILREPREALFSGEDGLDHYRKMFAQLEPKHIRYVMTESLLIQHDKVCDLASKGGYKLTDTDGLVQLFTKI